MAAAPTSKTPFGWRILVPPSRGRLHVEYPWALRREFVVGLLVVAVLAAPSWLMLQSDTAGGITKGIVSAVLLCAVALTARQGLGRSALEIRGDRLLATDAPWPANRPVQLDADDILQLYVADATWRPHSDPGMQRFHLQAMLRGSARPLLIAGLTSVDEARWLESVAEAALGIPDRPLSAESLVPPDDERMS